MRLHRWILVLTVAGAALGFAGGASAAEEKPLPKIREFDTATIDRLGHAIYAQDQLAWKATDVALAQRGGERGLRRDGMKGWVTTTIDGRDVVRMIKVVRGTPEALYDIAFAPGAEPDFSMPQNKVLSAEEVAQYKARMLALDNIGRPRCAQRYNTVALKDPEADGWLVWALASSGDDDALVVRGHIRFTISADGKTIREKDALSTTCLTYSKREMAKEGERRNTTALPIININHVVSTRPAETYVFTSLSYPFTFYVGTKDGLTWKFDKGNIGTVEDDAPDPDGFSARHFTGMAEVCVGIATDPRQNPRRYYPTKGAIPVLQKLEHAFSRRSSRMGLRLSASSAIVSRSFHPRTTTKL